MCPGCKEVVILNKRNIYIYQLSQNKMKMDIKNTKAQRRKSKAKKKNNEKKKLQN